MKTLKKQNNQIVEQNSEMKKDLKSYKDLINAELSDMKTGIGNLQVQGNEIGKSQEFISSQYESHRAMHTTITKKYVCIEKEQESLNIKIQKMEKEI